MTNTEIEKQLRGMAEWPSLWDQRIILMEAAKIVADHAMAGEYANTSARPLPEKDHEK